MKHVQMIMRVLVLAFVGCLFLPGLALAEPQVEVFIVEPPISNHLILPRTPLPKTCKRAKRMKVVACRGEYEPASFVLTTDQPLEGVKVEVGTLSGPAGNIPKEAVDIRTVKLTYREFHDNKKHEGQAIPILLLHDDSLFSIKKNPKYGMKKGDPGDPYFNVPRQPVKDSAELVPLRVEDFKQFWVTVHVPEHAAAGTYRAPVRIVARNAKAQELSLEVKVLDFRLLPPMLEYSIYYPAYLDTEDLPSHYRAAGSVTTEWKGTMGAPLSSRQYRLELENMLAHGVDNPIIYYIGWNATSLTRLEKMVRIREAVGMKKSLHLLGHPAFLEERPPTEEERKKSIEAVQEIVAWAQQRGYPEVYFMAGDEFAGERLLSERPSLEAIHAGGGKVFAAGGLDIDEFVGDLMDLPVIGSKVGNQVLSLFATMDPHDPEAIPRMLPEIEKAGSIRHLLAPEYRRAIHNIHARGFKCYTYMNPMPGVFFPEMHRRNPGLGLWRVGFDGISNWSFTHIYGSVTDNSFIWSYVWRTEDGVIDTLNWEAFREGVDDVRYLTTLLAALKRARGVFPNDPLVADSDKWLRQVDIEKGDLDQIRGEMIRRIEQLEKKVSQRKEVLPAVQKAVR